ncbi:GspH/FimT family pseudopilin [Verminephrobacter aporrectodeae]|uniref:GspH/FimT family pseudopilin n=1 Tax=Verminephrobacter aporrectodeae TaxID=1110389 RepID=UPI002243FB62|nr:GspH/FimT family pseudopilin [Verminephrobacter aporrectodeae]MCW8177406.1 type II secretion system protein GspH [Verminephrobacter aporrectodeae subsp. tuberculatae]MCW8204843.1 type II secretion system protein GspH [Verminephrobacter aporrectodeae subsp. tuberculatae]
MNRPPRAVDRRRVLHHGFTLLELLVVLVVAAITVSVVGVVGQGMLERSRYHQTLRDVVSQLKQAQELSVRDGRPIAVGYQPQTRQLVVDGRACLDIPEALQVRWEAAERSPGVTPASGATLFVFHAEGGAQGGLLAVSRGAQGMAFRVNWLLGTVEQTALDPP